MEEYALYEEAANVAEAEMILGMKDAGEDLGEDAQWGCVSSDPRSFYSA